MDGEENLTWLTGGDGGTVAAHAGSDDPQTAETEEYEEKSGECRADYNGANGS